MIVVLKVVQVCVAQMSEVFVAEISIVLLCEVPRDKHDKKRSSGNQSHHLYVPASQRRVLSSLHSKVERNRHTNNPRHHSKEHEVFESVSLALFIEGQKVRVLLN